MRREGSQIYAGITIALVAFIQITKTLKEIIINYKNMLLPVFK